MTTTITCTTCSGTGLVSGVDCTTCLGIGTLAVNIAGIDPSSITGDDNVDVDTSDYSAFLFVPENGNSSSKTPGVLLRLGSYCEIEAEADTADKAKELYPEEFVTNAADSTKAYEDAAGSTGTKGGILLSCDGHLLVKACEKTFIRSEGDINIEGGGSIIIRSNQNSGEENSIEMNDEEGGITIRSEKEVKRFLGHDFALTTGNHHSWTRGNVVGFTRGSKTYVTFGAENFMCFGSQVLVTCAGTLGLSVAIGLDMSISLKLKLWSVDVSYTLLKFSETPVKFDKSKVKVDKEIVALNNAVTKLESNTFRLANETAKVAKNNLNLLQNQIDVNKNGISVNSAEMNANRATLLHLFV